MRVEGIRLQARGVWGDGHRLEFLGVHVTSNTIARENCGTQKAELKVIRVEEVNSLWGSDVFTDIIVTFNDSRSCKSDKNCESFSIFLLLIIQNGKKII